MRRKSAIRALFGALGAAAAVMLLGACSDPKAATGFRLPDGKVDEGRAAFVRLNCTRCHTVSGEKFAEVPTPGVIVVPLGGEVVRVQTYGQLVTSIINPQHIVDSKYKGKYTTEAGASLMPDYNRTMTVDEVINLVTFLQVHYKLKMPEYPYAPPM